MSHLSLKRRGLREMGVFAENGIVGRHSNEYQSDRPWSSLDSEGQYFMILFGQRLVSLIRDSSHKNEMLTLLLLFLFFTFNFSSTALFDMYTPLFYLHALLHLTDNRPSHLLG